MARNRSRQDGDDDIRRNCQVVGGHRKDAQLARVVKLGDGDDEGAAIGTAYNEEAWGDPAG